MPVPAPSAPHAVNAARLDSPGKAAAARSAGGAGRKPDGGEAAAPDFGHKLSAAIQGKDDKQPDRAAGKAQASDAAKAATPAVPAHQAEPSDDDEATAAAGQLDSGLQAFVDSFPAPAIPATSSASSAAVAQESANASAAGEGKDAIAALAGARDAAAARAAIIDDKQAARAHGHAMPVIDAGDNADVEAGAEADAGQAGTPNAHASSRAQGITAGKPATELRAATPDAPGLRKLQPDASPIDDATGGGNGLLQAAAAAATGANAANNAAVQAAHVASRFGTPHWPDTLGQQVLWIAQNEQQVASLTLNPPDLGPVRVTLTVADGQASAAFVSLQPEVRQAIQDAVPRLKEMFADAGLQLQQASVDSGDAGRESAAHTQPGHGFGHAGREGDGDAADESNRLTDAATTRTARSMVMSRLVDLFA